MYSHGILFRNKYPKRDSNKHKILFQNRARNDIDIRNDIDTLQKQYNTQTEAVLCEVVFIQTMKDINEICVKQKNDQRN